jgi:hypothetical protein
MTSTLGAPDPFMDLNVAENAFQSAFVPNSGVNALPVVLNVTLYWYFEKSS